jgi:hypothetical protein
VHDFIPDDGGLADTRLCAGRAGRNCDSENNKRKTENTVTPIHFKTDRSAPLSYRIARLSDVVKLSLAATYQPDV